MPPEHFERSGATPVDDLNKLIETSDVISVHLPLNNATRGIVTAENLAHVKPGTLFINTARSEVIESGALLARLQKGDVPAALDVFDHEPLTADDAICHVPGHRPDPARRLACRRRVQGAHPPDDRLPDRLLRRRRL